MRRFPVSATFRGYRSAFAREDASTTTIRSPNKPLQRSGMDKVPGRGRGEGVLEQVLCARVLKCLWPAAERDC
jgi:hypothetical protein